jgi:hypothetical protein
MKCVAKYNYGKSGKNIVALCWPCKASQWNGCQTWQHSLFQHLSTSRSYVLLLYV